MTEHTYPLEIAIRADEKAKSAHERLDRMNGSIDRLGNLVAETNAKIDAMVAIQAHSDGIEQGEATQKRVLVDSRRFVITTFVVMLAALVAAVSVAIFH